MEWILYAVISALTFAFGDALVVKSGLESGQNGGILLFLTYTILMGIVCLIYLFNSDYLATVMNYQRDKWVSISLISLLFLVAYYTHYIALNLASNPGYANALVMFHVAILSIISYIWLNKPLLPETVFGIGLMFVGAFLVIKYSG